MTLRRGIVRSAQLVLLLAFGGCGSVTTTDNGSNPHNPDTGDAQPPDVDADIGAAPADSDTCEDCFHLYDLHWGMNGGLVAFVDMSRLGPCRSFTRERASGGVASPTTSCHADVPGCPARTINDIDRLISDPDVASSLRSHALYGGDPRPVDGQVFRFGVGNDYVDVGPPCGAGASGCVGIPASVRQLVDLLQELDRDELATEPCKSVFGG